MASPKRIRWFAIFVVVLVLVIVLFQHSERLTLPPGTRTKLPAGSLTPLVSMGWTHGLVRAGDGSLWSWGTNCLGWPVLGLSNVTETPFLRRIGSDTNWASINAGSVHNLAIKADGTMWAWGENIYGQFGIGTRLPTSVSVPVAGPPGNDWKQAAAGGSHSIALKKDGTLWAWGNNWAGQLGISSTNDTFVPVQIGSGTNWVRVWAGSLHGAAQQSDGSLWIWGDNPVIKQTARTSNNLIAPARISADTNWVDAAFGFDSFLAIKSDGTLWVWGRGARYYVGVKDISQNGTPAQVGTNSDWRSVAPHESRYHVLTKTDGSLWALEVENVPQPPPFRLTRIGLTNTFAAAGSGRVGTGVAVTPTGEVWTWGVVLGQETRGHQLFQRAAGVVRKFGGDAHWGDPQPIVREVPWLLPNLDPDASGAK